MKVLPTSIADVMVLEPQVFPDERGSFMEVWQLKKLAALGIDVNFVQANHSTSGQWVLRGLHFQIRQPQGKLVRVLSGEIFDVAVDLRRSSISFGRHVCVPLAASARQMVWVPPGFAHGFLVTSATAEVSYYCTDYYAPEYERSLCWNDPSLKIAWPLPREVVPQLNAKDASAARLNAIEYFP
jgi:dTDP-4-dehydrorhamnose 3,5-epimerase